MTPTRIAHRAYTSEQKAEILALVDRIGAVAAARERRMMARTIWRWMREARHAPCAQGVESDPQAPIA